MAAERHKNIEIWPIEPKSLPVSLEVAKRPVRPGLKSMVAATFDD